MSSTYQSLRCASKLFPSIFFYYQGFDSLLSLLSFFSIPYLLLPPAMCFVPPPGKKKATPKPGPKVSLEGARIILGPEGTRFSFSTTSKLPSNLFIRQDFYGKDKTNPPPNAQSLLPVATVSLPLYGQYTPAALSQEDTWPYITTPQALPPAPAPQPTNLVSQVAEAQRLACNLKDACASHASCSSRSSRSSDRDRDCIRDRDRDTLLLTLERKNAADIAALKLERDIERKVTSVVRDRDVQTLIGAARAGCHGGRNGFWASAGRGQGGLGGPGNSEGGHWGMHSASRAELELAREERFLRERERERERERAHIRERPRGGKLIGGPSSNSHLQLNLFQDLSGMSASGGSGGGRRDSRGHLGGVREGIRDGWERRRSSVVSTLDRGARRLMETVAKVEAEVEGFRRRDGEREREREWERGWRRERS
jgi:hypothetical protein